MKLLGVLLALLSVIKLYLVNSFDINDLNALSPISPISEENLYKCIVGIVLADGLIGLMCSLFIMSI